LRKSGQWDKTVILFCSDNGASAERLVRGDGHDPAASPGSAKTFLCLEPPWANLANAPLRKSKIFTHEGGISTPLIVHWPAGIAARGALRHTPVHFIDFAPTLLELAGAAVPATWNGAPRPPPPGCSFAAAFAKDRAESHDLATRHPEKVKELAALWSRNDAEFRKQGATGK